MNVSRATPMDGPLDYFPLWFLLIATIALIFLAVELGYRLGRYRRRKSPEKESPVGVMVGAMLGLLAFILAFTFGLAASRFDERRQTVLKEANAIGTSFLRAGLLPERQRTTVRQLLSDYVDVRLVGAARSDVERAMAKSAELHQKLWSEATAAAAEDPRSIVTGLFIQSLNDVIDLHSQRVMFGLRSRIPAVIWGVLYLVAMFTMATVGFQEGLAETRRSLASLALVITFSAVMFLILDLDRPREGLLRVSQESLTDLQFTLKTNVPK